MILLPYFVKCDVSTFLRLALASTMSYEFLLRIVKSEDAQFYHHGKCCIAMCAFLINQSVRIIVMRFGLLRTWCLTVSGGLS